MEASGPNTRMRTWEYLSGRKDWSNFHPSETCPTLSEKRQNYNPTQITRSLRSQKKAAKLMLKGCKKNIQRTQKESAAEAAKKIMIVRISRIGYWKLAFMSSLISFSSLFSFSGLSGFSGERPERTQKLWVSLVCLVSLVPLVISGAHCQHRLLADRLAQRA